MVEAVSPAKSIEMLQNYCADAKVGADAVLAVHCIAGLPARLLLWGLVSSRQALGLQV
jgi:hypothetical protein